MPAKFATRDKVVVWRLNSRTPKYIRDAIRLNRKRTVVGVFYDGTQQHTLYHLGTNHMGADFTHHGFRAEELKLAVARGVGRPRERRRRKPRALEPSQVPNHGEGGETPRFGLGLAAVHYEAIGGRRHPSPVGVV